MATAAATEAARTTPTHARSWSVASIHQRVEGVSDGTRCSDPEQVTDCYKR
jgi:hypothetical protein